MSPIPGYQLNPTKQTANDSSGFNT